MINEILNKLSEHFKIRSLPKKLLLPIIGLMAVSLLGSTLAFVIGTALTQTQLLKQQISAESQRIEEGLAARETEITTAGKLLAEDPHVVSAIVQAASSLTLGELNSRAVVIRERFDLDLVQIYNADEELRTNLLLPSLFRETSLLPRAESGSPIVRIVDGHALLLCRITMPENAGTVVVGINLEDELKRLSSSYRLITDLGFDVQALALDQHTKETVKISTHEDFPFNASNGRSNGHFSQHIFTRLGDIGLHMIMVRPTTDIQRVTNAGLTVMIISTLLTAALLLRLSLGLTRMIAQPMQQLARTADAVAKGDLTQRVDLSHKTAALAIGHHDEIGLLANAFNTMVSELQQLYVNLEGRVEARTHELKTVAEMARTVSSSLDLDVILQLSIHLVRSRMRFDYAALYLIDAENRVAVLREVSGKVGAGCEGDRVALQSNTLISAAATMHSPCVVENLEDSSAYFESYWLPGAKSAAAIPLVAGRDIIGVLEVQSYQTTSLSTEKLNLLNTLADQIVVGVKNSQLYISEQKRRRSAEVLELTGRVLSGTLDIQKVPERVLSMLNLLIPYQRGSLWIRSGEHLKSLARHGFPDQPRIANINLPAHSSGVYEQLCDTHKPLIVGDVTQEPGWIQQPGLPLHKSWLGVPIITQGNVIGMVSLTRLEENAFSEDDATWVQAFALQAGIALENASLYAEIAEFNEHLETMVNERTAELNRAYQILEHLDKTKSDFIEVTAHELRTPLTVIKAYGQMLPRFITAGDTETIDSAVNGIHSSTQRLHEIVNSLLDVARLDCQIMTMFHSELNLINLMDSIHGHFIPALVDRKLTFYKEGLENLPVIQADYELLYKVFYNLIINAIKYTPDGGKISVSGGIRKTQAQNYVEIVVQDSGIGIDPQHHEVIFEKFYQTGEVALHSSGRTKFKGGGPGLGLALVRGIVNAHGGRIWVESPGHDEECCPGSRFYVWLPLDAREQVVAKSGQIRQLIQ